MLRATVTRVAWRRVRMFSDAAPVGGEAEAEDAFAAFADEEYRDENTRIEDTTKKRVLMLRDGDVKAVQARHLAVRAGLFMCSRHTALAEAFKAAEEKRWAEAAKLKAAKREAHKSGRQVAVNEKEVYLEEQERRNAALLENMTKLDSMKDGPEMMRESFLGPMLESLEKETLTGDHGYVGLLGITHRYYAEDHALYRYKKQPHSSEYGPEEEALDEMANKRKIRGILEEFKLIPSESSKLWLTEDLDSWRYFYSEGEALEDQEETEGEDVGHWGALTMEQAADVASDVVSKDLFPGARSREESEAKWAEREALTKRLQSTIRVHRNEFPVEITTRTYWEPTTKTKERVRYRERKCTLRVHVPFLQLPGRVHQRLLELAAQRYDPKTRMLQVTGDRYRTKEENNLFCLLLMRSLLAEAYKVHPRYVSVHDDAEVFRQEHNARIAALIEEGLQSEKVNIFRMN